MPRQRQNGSYPPRGDQGIRPRGPAPIRAPQPYEGSIIMTDGNTAYRRIPDRLHDENVLPTYVQAHHVLKHVHRVFSNLKRWAMGVYHGLRKKHIDIYLQEFVFRWNRRRHIVRPSTACSALAWRSARGAIGTSRGADPCSVNLRSMCATRGWRIVSGPTRKPSMPGSICKASPRPELSARTGSLHLPPEGHRPTSFALAAKNKR